MTTNTESRVRTNPSPPGSDATRSRAYPYVNVGLPATGVAAGAGYAGGVTIVVEVVDVGVGEVVGGVVVGGGAVVGGGVGGTASTS